MLYYRMLHQGYTDEEMRVLKHMCKDILEDIHEFERMKERKKKERKKKEAEKRKRSGEAGLNGGNAD